MVLTVNYEGLVFTGDCEHGAFTQGQILCPNCRKRVDPSVNAGSAYLICSTEKQGCTWPSKSFCDRGSMDKWLETAWQAVAGECRKRRPEAQD